MRRSIRGTISRIPLHGAPPSWVTTDHYFAGAWALNLRLLIPLDLQPNVPMVHAAGRVDHRQQFRQFGVTGSHAL